MQELLLDVGGIGLSCCVASPALARALAHAYAAFRVEGDGPVHMRLDVEGEGGPGLWEEPVVRLHGACASLTARGLAAELDCAAGTGTVRVDSTPATLSVEYTLRVACAALATWQGALLAHAAGILTPRVPAPSALSWPQAASGGEENVSAAGRGPREWGEAAYLFWGPSGAGKTTAARMTRQAGAGVVLNDDLLLLRREDGVWRAHGTPFTNPTQTGPGRRGNGVVRAVLHLLKARDPEILPLAAPDALARVAVGVPVVMAEPSWAARALGVAMRLVREVPQVELAFQRDLPFWPVIARWEASRAP